MVIQLIKILFLVIILCSSSCYGEEDSPEDMELIVVHPNPEDDWLFGFHDAISDSVHGTALWFDSFFATDEIEGTKQESTLRIRLGWEPRARDWGVFSQKFRLNLHLPHLENQVDLILSDETDDENNNDKAVNGRNVTTDKDESFTAALRFVNVDKLTNFIDTRIGLSSNDVFAKVRLKLLSSSSQVHRFEFQPSIYYYLDDGFGQKVFVEYTYNHSTKKQFRANYSIKFSDGFEGNRWQNSLNYLRQIDRRRASAIRFSTYGEDNAGRGFLVDNYRFSYLYRMNAYRKWLYFEIEPFLDWPEEYNYSTTPGIALRVEGYFTKDR